MGTFVPRSLYRAGEEQGPFKERLREKHLSTEDHAPSGHAPAFLTPGGSLSRFFLDSREACFRDIGEQI